jgi:cysteine dioxygenase
VAVTPKVAAFIQVLDRFSERIPLADLTQLLHESEVELSDVHAALGFGRHTYQRNLLHAGPAYHALVLCWRAGQRSPIHDHRGSSCGVRVIHGVATETVFAQTSEGLVYATGSRAVPVGSVCGSEDADIHQMSNLQPPGRDLVTLHVYSPPLLIMGKYSLTEALVSEFTDPVVEFAHGGGI